MLDLTFGEQVKIILSRKNMTIKELAETIEKRTGKKMSRQNLTQRLGRDNFQEQDMRMIADILGCPFRLSILADSEEVERAASIADIGPTRGELNKLAKAKEKKEKKHLKERKGQRSEASGAERDMTIGELMDIHKELDDLMMETGKLPAVSEEDWKMSEQTRQKTELKAAEEKELEETESPKETGLPKEREETKEAEETKELKVTIPEEEPDVEELEATAQNTVEELGEEHSRKKSKGWRAYLQKITHKEGEKENGIQEQTISNPDMTEIKAEKDDDAEDDYIDYESSQIYSGEPETLEYEELEDISEEDEDIELGEINPDTGHEYETNSVRMHPKRIGYVQVYDRSDHRWTDMTEWAFLGYQERKKALLGKDYEPPIYLD